MTRLTSFLGNLFGGDTAPKTARKTTLGIQTLEAREVPAIDLLGGQLTITGGAHSDAVSVVGVVGPGADVVTHVKASRLETRVVGGQVLVFQESKTFAAGAVTSIRAELGEGTNSFTSGVTRTNVVIGGSGKDTMTGSHGIDYLYGNGGDDVLKGGGNVDYLYGGAGNDNLDGGDGSDLVWAGDGNDVATGGLGNDTLRGEAGDDQLNGGDGDDTAFGGDGNDTLTGVAGADTLIGDGGNDTVTGGDGNDVMNGMEGNDNLDGGAGNDQIWGANGNDVMNGGAGNDSLWGGAGNDRLLGGAGNDTIWGNDGADFLSGGNGTDTLYGGAGVDTLIAVDGAIDIVYGGSNTPANSERDRYWLDSLDNMANLAVVNAAVDRTRAVNVVSGYRSYLGNGQLRTVALADGVGDLFDPVAQAGDNPAGKANFAASPLFEADGLAYNDIDQGAVGSCYFLAKLSAVARAYPQAIRDMVTDLGDGTYAVRFYHTDGSARYVRVDGDLWVNSANKPIYADLTPDGAVWVAIVEKAWAVFRDGIADYGTINGGHHGTVSTSFALGLNDTAITNLVAPTGFLYVSLIKAQLDAGRAVTLGCPAGFNNNTPMTPENEARGQHIYMVHSVETNSQGVPTKICLYNLYGGGLIEITDFNRLRFCSAGANALSPK